MYVGPLRETREAHGHPVQTVWWLTKVLRCDACGTEYRSDSAGVADVPHGDYCSVDCALLGLGT